MKLVFAQNVLDANLGYWPTFRILIMRIWPKYLFLLKLWVLTKDLEF